MNEGYRMDQNVHHKASISRRNPVSCAIVSAIIAKVSSTFLNDPPSYARDFLHVTIASARYIMRAFCSRSCEL